MLKVPCRAGTSWGGASTSVTTSRVRSSSGTSSSSRIGVVEGLAREVHLRDELVIAPPGHLEVDVRRAPPLVVHGVGAGENRREAVAPLLIRSDLPPALEGGVLSGRVGVGLVVVPAVRVRLPDLDERAGDGPELVIKHLSADGDDVALGPVGAAPNSREVEVFVRLVPRRVEGALDLRRRRAVGVRPG